MSGKLQGPLAGATAFDLTSVLMGPYATQIMADLGAGVIEVESPEGDTTRYLPPGPNLQRGGMFLNVNRGKRSHALNLKRADDRVTAAARHPYRTKDGFIGVTIHDEKHWQNFFQVLGDPEWTRDPMYQSMQIRAENIGVVLAKLAEVMEGRTTEEWVELLHAAEVPAMQIASLTDFVYDPHLEEASFWTERDSEFGKLRFPGTPTTFLGTPGASGDTGPALGADGPDILPEPGFTPDAIDALIGSGNTRVMS